MHTRNRNISIALITFTVIVIGAWYLSGTNNKSSALLPLAQLPLAAPSNEVLLQNGEEYTLTASMVRKVVNGEEVRMLAYNGSIPGPTIRVTQGAEVKIRFVNDIDSGSTIHSHGVRLDNAFDGVPGVTQPLVMPGESFEYTIKFPDAGVYWYHPHFDEPYEQMMGLYGNFVVTPLDGAYWSPVNREIPITLGDILIGADGQPVPFTKGRTDHTLMGRYGNVLLTQGATDHKLTAKKGEVVRLYLTNVANATPFNFTIPGVKMKLVGSDNGRYEHEMFVDGVILGPSERAVVDVFFPESGIFPIEHKTPVHTHPLGSFTVTDDAITVSHQKEFETLRVNAATRAEFKALDGYQTKVPDKTIRLTVDMPGMGGMMSGSGSGMMGMHRMPDGSMMHNDGSMVMGSGTSKIEWEDTMAMMNAMSDQNSVQWQMIDEETKLANMDVNWKFKVGDKVKIRVVNDGKSMHPMQHPIHFHGERFVVLATNGVPSTNMVWKDTTLVQTGDTVDILLEVTNPGDWMAHCHVAEHLADGMMINFSVTK
jgi:FtsP/CotA-like multicopper oxidase with cupredoxin domain